MIVPLIAAQARRIFSFLSLFVVVVVVYVPIFFEIVAGLSFRDLRLDLVCRRRDRLCRTLPLSSPP